MSLSWLQGCCPAGLLTPVSCCRCQLQVLLRLELCALSSPELDTEQASEEVGPRPGPWPGSSDCLWAGLCFSPVM